MRQCSAQKSEEPLGRRPRKKKKTKTTFSHHFRYGIAIDPGKRSGWAIWDECFIESFGVIDGDDIHAVKGFLEKNWKCNSALTVEGQYFSSRGGAASWSSLGTLMSRRYEWEVLGRVVGYEIHVVLPVQWQSYFRLMRKGETKKEHKKALNKYARYMVGKEIEPDACDAALIAQYMIHHRELVVCPGTQTG